MVDLVMTRLPGIRIVYGEKGTGKSTLVMEYLLACVKGSVNSIEEAPFNKAVLVLEDADAWQGKGLFKKERSAASVNIWKGPESAKPAEWTRTLCAYLSVLYGLKKREKSCLEEAAMSTDGPLTFASLQERLNTLVKMRMDNGRYTEYAVPVLAMVKALRSAVSESSLFTDGEGSGIQEAFSRSGLYILGREAKGKEGDFLYGTLAYSCLCYPRRPAPVLFAVDGSCTEMFPDNCPVTDRLCSEYDGNTLLLADEKLTFSRKIVRSAVVTMCSGGREGVYVIGSVEACEKGAAVITRNKSAIQNMARQFARNRKSCIEGGAEWYS